MRLTATIEDVQYAASICLKCGCCAYGDWPENHPLCSLFYPDQTFANCAGGVMSTITALAEDKLDYAPDIAEIVYTCAGCLSCDSQCSIIRNHPPKVEMIDMIRLLRRRAVTEGLIPKGLARQLSETIKKSEKITTETIELPTEINDRNAGQALFIEQGASASQKRIHQATAGLLAKIGDPIYSIAEKGFNGATLYDFGSWDELIPQMAKNWEQIKSTEGKTIVFTDPHSLEFMTKRYPENIDDCDSLNTVHITRIISDALKRGKLKSSKSTEIKVSFHDPCYLGRGMGGYDAPREVLAAMEKVELIEMRRNRKNSYCCGARIAGNFYSDHANAVAGERVEEFLDTGADLLITACSFCAQNLREAFPDGKKDLVKDITEFVNERV